MKTQQHLKDLKEVLKSSAYLASRFSVVMAYSLLLSVAVATLMFNRSMGYPSVVTAPPDISAYCPNPPGNYPLLLPNPSDCGSYYICSWNNVAYLQDCPTPLHFNPALQVCDSPAHFTCTVTTTASPLSNTTSATTINTSKPGPTLNSTYVIENKPSTPSPEFNSSAVIQKSYRVPTSHISESNNPTEVITAPPEVAAQCPPFSPGSTAMIPDPTSCGNFYMCLGSGSAILQHCPPGLHFNPSLQVCDFPQNVNCVVSSTTAPVPSESTPMYINTFSTPVPSNNLTKPTPLLNFTAPIIAQVTRGNILTRLAKQLTVVTAPPEIAAQCPPFSPGSSAMIPDPIDCGNFYVCLGTGSAIFQRCPPGLHFNPSLQVCDFPQNVNCIVSATEAPVPSQSTTTSESTISTNVPSTNSSAIIMH
ncbi:hypothetical protein SK128_010476 [Halocaridina rubra]|uniref:Chitin-binding type-2 domain-containing protein n=1 Tax=Halocaridina rubra TaxID=373956 RepID=A0AAN8XAC4_HALRR